MLMVPKSLQWAAGLGLVWSLVAACGSRVTGTASGDGDGDGLGGDGGDGDVGDSGGAESQSGGNGTGAQDGAGGSVTTCIEGTIDSASSSADTTESDDVFSLSCAGGNAPDLAYAWTAPFSGYFSFDTDGSDYDTAIAIFEGGCEGSEIACSSGVGASPYGRAIAKVQKDETYLVVFSGNAGDSGEVQLSVDEVTCPGTDLTDQPLPAEFTTVAGPDDHSPPCDVQGITPQPEKTFRFTADEAGLYRFSASSEAFRPVITAYRGVICGGDYLACNAAQVGATAHPAQVGRYLNAGESLTLIVEGENGSGQFTFDIEKLPAAESGGCYDVPPLGSGASGTVSPSSDPNEISTSCGWAGNAFTHYSEIVYGFTVNVPDTFASCTVDVELSGIGGVYLLGSGDCSGPELECYEANHAFTFSLADNGEYLLALENQDPFAGSLSYTITSTCN